MSTPVVAADTMAAIPAMPVAFKVFVLSVVFAGVLDMLITQKVRRHLPGFSRRIADDEQRWTVVRPIRLLLGENTMRFMRTRTLRFPGAELLFGGLVLISLYLLGLGAEFARAVVYLLFGVPLIVIPWLDNPASAWTPRDFTYPGIAAGLAMGALSGVDGIVSSLIGAAVTCGLFLVQILFLSSARMGMGVAKAGAMVGAFCGFPESFNAVWLTYMLGGGVSIVLLVTKKVGRGDAVAFSPFLITGGLVALWWPGLLIG